MRIHEINVLLEKCDFKFLEYSSTIESIINFLALLLPLPLLDLLIVLIASWIGLVRVKFFSRFYAGISECN